MSEQIEEHDDRMDGGLDAFLAQAVGAEDDGEPQEALASSEQDGDGRTVEDQVEAEEGLSDEAETEAPQETRGRLVRNLAKQEKALTGARSRIKELESEVARLKRESEDPEDAVEMLRGRVAKKMGLRPDDPRVSERLFDISQDLTIAHLGEAADRDPELKQRRQQLAEDRRRRDERLAQERRIEELERRDRDREAAAQRREAVDAVRSMLSSNPHPFLSAAVEDPAGEVVELAMRAISEGHVELRTPEDGARLVQQIAANLESAHKAKAKKLAGLLGNSAAGDLRTQMNTDDRGGAASRKQGGATKLRAGASTTSGGGGRGRPTADPEMADDEGPEDLHAFVNRMAQRAQATRRGAR